MSIKKLTTGAVALTTALALAACSDDDDDDAADATTSIATDQVAGSTDDPDADIEAAKNLFIGALDDLGIEHSDPVGSQPQLAGARPVSTSRWTVTTPASTSSRTRPRWRDGRRPATPTPTSMSTRTSPR